VEHDLGRATRHEHHLDVARRPRFEAQRLGHRLLRAEARGEVLPGPRPPGGVRTLAVGEQPPSEPRTPLERALEALDLEEVHADAGHGADSSTRWSARVRARFRAKTHVELNVCRTPLTRWRSTG
jgi:hypothetical protein